MDEPELSIQTWMSEAEMTDGVTAIIIHDSRRRIWTVEVPPGTPRAEINAARDALECAALTGEAAAPDVRS